MKVQNTLEQKRTETELVFIVSILHKGKSTECSFEGHKYYFEEHRWTQCEAKWVESVLGCLIIFPSL